jgi:hypothetical protein
MRMFHASMSLKRPHGLGIPPAAERCHWRQWVGTWLRTPARPVTEPNRTAGLCESAQPCKKQHRCTSEVLNEGGIGDRGVDAQPDTRRKLSRSQAAPVSSNASLTRAATRSGAAFILAENRRSEDEEGVGGGVWGK